MNIRTLTISTHNPPAGGPNRETMVTPVESSYTKLTESLLRSGVRPGIRGSNSSGTRLTQAMRAEKRPLSPASLSGNPCRLCPRRETTLIQDFEGRCLLLPLSGNPCRLCPRRESNSHQGLRRPLLYPLSYKGGLSVRSVGRAGFEPATVGLRGHCSTN